MADVLTAAAGCVLVTATGEATGDDLLRAAARIAAALPAATPGSHITMAFDRDRTAFLATLLAVWARGHAAALPVDARRNATAAVLARPEVTGFAHDTGVGLVLDVPKLLAVPARRADGPGRPLPLVGAVTCHAAAPGGGMVTTTRTWSQAQLAELLAATAARLDLPAAATVWNGFPAGTPCALVVGLLAPLRAGCRIAGEPLASPDELATRTAALGVHTIVAPAAMLRRLARVTNWPGTEVVQVVAADEPLDERTIAHFAGRGIRAVTLPDTLSTTTTDARTTALLHQVLSLDGVDDAAVVIVDGTDGPHCCCVVATNRGEDALRRALPPLGSPGLPTSLRCLPVLPRCDDGRLPRDVLLRLFGRGSDGVLETTTLRIDDVPTANGDDSPAPSRFQVTVPANYSGFAGHFPTYPVLSGAVQLHELVLPCLRRALGAPVAVAGFQDLKFLARIGPGATVQVTLRFGPERRTAEFDITRDGTRCSSGRITLRPSAGASAS